MPFLVKSEPPAAHIRKRSWRGQDLAKAEDSGRAS